MFLHPWVLLLLVGVPAIGWWMWAGKGESAIEFSSTEFSKHVRRTWRQRLSWIPGALTLLALALMIIALARPREGREHAVIDSEGIAIEMVVDRSGSMQAMDFKIDGEHVDRLTAIKNVASHFVIGKESNTDESPLEGRYSDLVGLISFAGYADALTPPTLDHSFLVSKLNQLQIVDQRSEDGTAIGDAVSLAIEKLNALDARKSEKVKSKVVILLTDGENNAGEIEPVQAAELAKAMDIRVYTIGVGTRGQAPVPVRHPLTGRQTVQWMDVNIDEDTLREIASATGGKYFRATDTQSLEKIYAEIDQMEKTKVEAQHFVDYQELAIQSFRLGAWKVPAIIMIAMWMLVARLLLSHTIFRQFA